MLFFSCFSLGIWFFVCDHHQLCISTGSFYSAVYEQIILQDSPAVYGVSCCWCVEWQWNHSSHPSCKFHEINENIIFATFSFSNPFVNLLWLWCALPNHSGKCGFQTFQKVKCSPCFSRLYFQDIFYIFGRRFLRLSPLEGTIVSLNNKPDQKKEKNRCTCWVHLWHIEAGCVFVGMEGDRGKYKAIPRFQISKGACLHAVIHKLRN